MKYIEAAINATVCDTVVIATPIDLNRIVKINKPTVKVGYDLQEILSLSLRDVVVNAIEHGNLEHGHGIFMARNAFDTVTYGGVGNQVILVKCLKQPDREKAGATAD